MHSILLLQILIPLQIIQNDILKIDHSIICAHNLRKSIFQLLEDFDASLVVSVGLEIQSGQGEEELGLFQGRELGEVDAVGEFWGELVDVVALEAVEVGEGA